MDFTTIFMAMVKLFLILIVGYVCHKTKIFPEQTQSVLTRVVLYVATPCTILYSVLGSTQLPDAKTILLLLGVTVICYLVVGAFVWVAVRLLKLSPERRSVYMAMLLFSNCGFIGVPVVQTIFGNDAVFIASVYNMPFQLLLYSLGAYLSRGGKYSKHAGGIKLSDLINPCIIAGLLSIVLALTGWRTPGVATDTIAMFGNVTTPASLLVIGISIAKQPVKKMLGEPRVYILTVLRLAVIPALVWAVSRPLLGDPLQAGVAAVLFGMPVAAMIPLLAAEGGADDTDAVRGVFLSTVLSMVTIPLLVTILM